MTKDNNRKAYKRTIDYYDKNALDYADKLESIAPIKEIEEFIKLVKKGIILDVACAAGRDSRLLAEFGFKVIGIDLSKGLLKEAKKRSPKNIKFKFMDMRNIKYPKNFFNGIYASAALLHLPTFNDVKICLKEFCRILKPNGVIYISVKAQQGVRVIGLESHKYSGSFKRFFRFFKLKSFKELIKTTGFKIIKADYRKKEVSKDKRKIKWIVIYARKPKK